MISCSFDTPSKNKKSTISDPLSGTKIVDNVDKSFAQELLPYFIYISGSHGYQQITRCTFF